GKAQPPPGKNRRLAPDAHFRAALRLRRPTFPCHLSQFVGPVRRSRHRAKTWRLAPDAHSREALRLHRPTFP
ncbi:hypothetical protein U8Y08_14260, partial [Klebsiella pneumoniae]|nr:hypothetical protein [Klebsiella pneumoniae]